MKQIAITILTVIVLFGVFVNTPAYFWSLSYWFGNGKLGATLTTLTATDKLVDFPATYNANLTEINSAKMETSTTSVAGITTLSGLTSAASLATVGTITSGTWNGTVIDVARGGTNIASFTAGDILYATGATTLAKLAAGASSTLLHINASGLPEWQVSAGVDQAQNFAWTGSHTFTQNVGIGTSTPYTSLGVSGEIVADNFTATTTATSSLPQLQVDTRCSGCMSNVEYAYATSTWGVSSDSRTATAQCTSGRIVIGGGAELSVDSSANMQIITSTRTHDQVWTAVGRCDDGASCDTRTITAQAICVDP